MVESIQDNNDEISLLDIIAVIRKRWKLMVILPAIVAVLSIVVVLLMPRTYQSIAKVVSFNQEELLPLGVLKSSDGGRLGGISSVTLKQQSMPILQDLMQSVPLEAALAQKFGFADVNSLRAVMKAKINKSGVLEITVEHTNKQVAAAIANAAVQELGNRAYSINLVKNPKITADHDLDRIGPDDNVVLKLLQPATEGDKPIKPKRSMIVMLSVVSSFFVSLLVAFFLEWMGNLSPEDKARWEQIKRQS